jgi:hypothetical protein
MAAEAPKPAANHRHFRCSTTDIFRWLLTAGARALSQGRTREEARSNVLDALRLMLSPEPGEHGESESLELTIAP